MIAYPGRTFGQLYHRFIKGNALVTGSIELGDRTISLADVTAPVLVFAGATDGIAPIAAVRPLVDLLTGSRDVRFEVVPGGHLGMLTGRAARGSTWQVLDEWIQQWSSAAAKPAKRAAAKRGATKKAAKKPVAKKTAARKRAATKAPAKKAAAKRAAAQKAAATSAAATKSTPRKATTNRAVARTASADAIGANTSRRYGSAGSRALSR
jgi:polyhydroxyalkanoate synthase